MLGLRDACVPLRLTSDEIEPANLRHLFPQSWPVQPLQRLIHIGHPLAESFRSQASSMEQRTDPE